jgi:hypothetical protein
MFADQLRVSTVSVTVTRCLNLGFTAVTFLILEADSLDFTLHTVVRRFSLYRPVVGRNVVCDVTDASMMKSVT